MMASPRGLFLTTLLSLFTLTLLLHCTHFTSAAPTPADSRPEHTDGSSSTLSLKAPINPHHSNSHPIWHLLLALWRPKDPTSSSLLATSESQSFSSALTSPRKSTDLSNDFKENVQSGMDLPLVRRKGKLNENSDSDMQTITPTIVVQTTHQSTLDSQSLYRASDTTQHADLNTNPNPTLITDKNIDSTTSQHHDFTPQRLTDTIKKMHRERNSQLRSNPDTHQQLGPEMKEPPDAMRITQQRKISSTHSYSDLDKQQPNTEIQTLSDSGTPQHPTRNTKQKSISSTVLPNSATNAPQHPTSNTKLNTNSSSVALNSSRDTPPHPTRYVKLKIDSSSILVNSSRGTPHHPARNIRPKMNSSNPLSSSSYFQQHKNNDNHTDLDQDTLHLTREMQGLETPTAISHVDETMAHTAGTAIDHPTTYTNKEDSHDAQLRPKPTGQQNPEISDDSKLNLRHPVSGSQHSLPDTQTHHSIPRTDDYTESPLPHHLTQNVDRMDETFPEIVDQTNQSHSTHEKYHSNLRTQHHPVLHIQPHPTSHTTHGLEPLNDTPWRLHHADLPFNALPSTQEEKTVTSHEFSAIKSSTASTDSSESIIQDENLDITENSESNPAKLGIHRSYPTLNRRQDEQNPLPVEPKLDDHFFVHPMPHHRDIMLSSPSPNHPDTLEITSKIASTTHSSISISNDSNSSSSSSISSTSSSSNSRNNNTSNISTSSSSSSRDVGVGHDSSIQTVSSSYVESEVQMTEESLIKELPAHVEGKANQNTSTLHSESGKKILQVQGPVEFESLSYSSLDSLVGQPSEIINMKDNETAVLAMLKIGQTLGSPRDTLQTNAMIQTEDLAGPGDGRYTEISHRNALHNLDGGASRTTAAKLVQTESGGRERKAVIMKMDLKSGDTKKTVNAIEDVSEKKEVDVTQEQNIENIVSTMKPIYEEISGVLKVDTSIDDVEDFDVQMKHTEHSEEFIPPANTSHINLIDISLHTPDPSDLSNSSEASSTQTFTSYSSSDPETSQASTTHTFTNYPSHYPPKTTLNPEADGTITTVGVAEGTDNWSPFVATQDLVNTSLALNASLIQRSHVLSIEEHYKMVLRERGSLMLQLMDPTADPCEDFYQFACGRWNGKFPIRQDKAVDNTFERLKEDLDDVLRSLLEEEPLPTDNNITLTVKTLYGGCMNTEAIEAMGAEPLLSLLQELGGWPVLEGDAWNATNYDWVRQMARLRNYNNDILISEWVAADITNSSNHIIQLDQPELGLPGREYFINPGDYQYREAYLDLMLNVAQMLGAPHPVALKDMNEVLQFETHLSRILTPAEERRNLSAVHRRLTVEQLSAEVPQIDWAEYLDIITWHNNHTGEVVVFGLEYFKKLVSLLEYTDDRTISNYLLWRFVKNRISNLGDRYTKVKQDYIKVLFGRQSQPERWRSCVTYVSGNLGYVVGAMFVKRYFPEASKNDTDEMIGLIRESFGLALQGAHWMNEETRHVAQEKVNTIVKNVGYPEYLLNDTYMDQIYAELSFNKETHFDNVLKMLQFHACSNHALLSVPVNRTAWVTSPAVVNAYYSRSKNMIVFPAGILQPPFYHPAFPRSLNYGGIGVVIGHEITHGFDDRGRQFDKNGNLQQWWTPNDVSKFYQRASCMLDQYGEYEVDEVGLKINPVNTLGENIADNAGIKISYQAYQNWRKNNEETVSLPFVNLTHDQLFFLNFGQIWCEINSPEAMLTKIRSGQHSPNKFRVIGTLSNSEEFSEAFSCPLGSAMNPERKCSVW